MQPEDFRQPEAGECVRTIDRQWAFVPGPLPATIDLNAIWRELGEADTALGAVEELSAGTQLPLVQMLIAASVRREAALSSQIEGIQTQLPDLLRAEVEDPDYKHASDDLRETRNYVSALYQGVELLRSGRPIAARLVTDLHATLLEGTRGGNLRPGEFRKVQNYIGPPGAKIGSARYVPPPVTELPRLLTDWENFANSSGEIPDLVRCAILHHRFEAIHPFVDGNGRVGRLLIPLFLIDRKRLVEPMLYLSDYFESHRREYYDLIQQVHTDHDWIAWIRFFLVGVRYASRKVLRQAKEMSAFRDIMREKLAKKFRARGLLDELFANPYVDTARAAEKLKVGRKTAGKSIQLLEEVGVLREITGRNWGRIWEAPSILKIINTPDEL